ncbi:MAG: S8 family serine peptidase [bacterium]
MAAFAALATIAAPLRFACAAEPPTAPLYEAPDAWRAKVSPAVLDRASAEPAAFFVWLGEQADVRAADALPTKESKGAFVFATLREVADRTQAPILRDLEARGVEHRSLWLVNAVWVRGGLDDVERMARRGDVARIVHDARGTIVSAWPTEESAARGGVEVADANEQSTDARGTSSRTRVSSSPALGSASAIEWNLAWVNAPSVWADGVTGAGAVVGTLDTGAEWQHPAIRDHYRGWDGASADHNYNWHDAIHGPIQGACDGDSPEPCDNDGHGTHVTGTMVGDDGGANQVGMAPDAKWIGCRLWEPALRTYASYCLECFEWMLAPTDMSNQNPDPSKAPHVINNSWMCEPVEGCTDVEILRPAVENLRAAGVMVVASAGNDGQGCSTIWYPPAIYDATFTVGATKNNDTAASFSSRGPVTVDGSNRIKPDIGAPGVGIRSSTLNGTYATWDGTSMAGPHVAGLVALLVSANPALAGNVDLIEQIIRDSAVPRTAAQTCGGTPGTEIPNNTFGYGRIDAYAAYTRAVATAVDGGEPAPAPASRALAALELPAPNPATESALIRYRLDAPSLVTLSIIDASGRRVRTLRDRAAERAGEHAASWDGRVDDGTRAASGVYFARLRAGGVDATERLTFIRAR